MRSNPTGSDEVPMARSNFVRSANSTFEDSGVRARVQTTDSEQFDSEWKYRMYRLLDSYEQAEARIEDRAARPGQ